MIAGGGGWIGAKQDDSINRGSLSLFISSTTKTMESRKDVLWAFNSPDIFVNRTNMLFTYLRSELEFLNNVWELGTE